MLFGKYFGGCHQASLKTIVDGYEHRHKRNKGLSRPYVALQKTVHLLTVSHIGTYFFHHPLLCIGKFEGQVVRVEPIELCANSFKIVATILTTVVAGIP